MKGIIRILSGSYLPYLLCIALIVPFFVIGLYTHPSYDDYWVYSAYQEKGVWGCIKHWYSIWTGRYSALFISLVTHPLIFKRIDLHGTYSCISLILTFLSLLLLFAKMFPELSKKNLGWLFLAVVFLLLYYLPSSYEFFYLHPVVYNYNVWLFFTTAAVWLIDSRNFYQSNLKYGVLALLLFVAVGINEMLSLILLFFAVVLIFLRHYQQKIKKQESLLQAGIVLVLIGSMAVSFLAPGNFSRQEYFYVDKVPLAVSIKMCLTYCIHTVKNLLMNGPFLLLILPAFALRSTIHKVFSPVTRNGWLLLLWLTGVAALFFAMAFMVFYGSGTLSEDPARMVHARISNFLLLYLLMILPLTFALVIDYFQVKKPVISIGFMIPLLGYLALNTVASKNTISKSVIELRSHVVQDHDAEMKAIYELCKRNQGKDIVIPPIQNRPSSVLCLDVQPDPEYLYNRFFAEYHGIKSIRSDSSLVK
jgi:hypothetical protein